MPIDWTQLQKKYQGQWIALTADEKTVVASGHTLKAAHRRAQAQGIEKPFMSFVPKEAVSFVGAHAV